MATDAACPSCGAARLERTEVSPEVTAASIAVHGERLTILHCGCGHVEVPAELGRATRAACDDALPSARRALLRGERCRSCGSALSIPGRRTTRAVTVSPETVPVATLRFDLPMLRCPNCGLDQVPYRARHDVVVALSALFQAAVDRVSGDDAVDPQDLGPLQRLNHALRRHRRWRPGGR